MTLTDEMVRAALKCAHELGFEAYDLDFREMKPMLEAALAAAPKLSQPADITGAIAGERERCALVAEHLNGWGIPQQPELAAHIAKVIRAG